MVSSDEVWKDIPNYEGFYQVSNQGRIKGVARTVVGGGTVAVKNLKERIIQPHLSGDKVKYPTVNVSKEGEKGKVKVHQAVLEAFKGPRPSPDHEARHLNDDPEDNRPENLEWGTRNQNAEDKFRNGYVSHRKILTPEQEASVASDPRSQREIAKDYDVSQKVVWRIKQNSSK